MKKEIIKEKSFNEYVYEHRKRIYHETPRVAYREDIELARIADQERELQEKIIQRQRARFGPKESNSKDDT